MRNIMKMKLLVLAKSDKNNGYCVVGINIFGKFVRLVKNRKGHALAKESCNFNKMDFLTVVAMPAPLIHQKENYVLGEIIYHTINLMFKLKIYKNILKILNLYF